MYFRHCCKVKFIGALNEKLTVAQKEYIASTPFWWFAMLKQSLKISRNVLSQLCSKWVERMGGLMLVNEPSRFEFYVVGCAYLLELWSFDHLVVCQSTFKCKMNLFPRLLYWMNVSVGDKVIKTAFDYDMAIVDVAVSKEELDHAIVREAFEHFGTEYKTQDLKDKEELERLVQHHEVEIADLEQSMSALDELVANWKGQQPKDEVRDEVGNDVFIDPRASVMSVEKDDGAQQSNMYDRMKARPRMRFKSVATKTPYSVYGKKKLKSLQIG
ncbi:hypothetical protein DEO72_LG10g1780 [Vigna unguiculata]|uniref:Uncharacterized protein n=1 Tax=Vigna unguiculata TaxID=3917 RepID=A0A4D6N9L1_VIGUN|nr:hypothetical protein DEO72_LG10g1780 [Vigna unguiculata]